MNTFFSKVRRVVLTICGPMIKVIGLIVVPHKSSLDEEQLLSLMDIVQPGDVLLSRTKYAASNLIIPGYWKHAALCIGDKVIEAVGSGVRRISVRHFAEIRDEIIVLSPKFATPEEGVLATNFAKTLVGQPYDYLVEYDDNRKSNLAFYCSEIPWWCYNQVFLAQGKVSPFTPRLTLGMQTITPQDYANAVQKWRVKWNSLDV